MQDLLFDFDRDSLSEDDEPFLPALLLKESDSSNYQERTVENANSACLTVAFAVDFASAGEKLTARAAGKRYLAIPFGMNVQEAAKQLLDRCKADSVKVLNVAGNSAHTFAKCEKPLNQAQINQWVYQVLRAVCSKHKFRYIRSGGQTGIDIAGTISAYRLKVPTLALFPKGFRQRLADGRDVLQEPSRLVKGIEHYANLL